MTAHTRVRAARSALLAMSDEQAACDDEGERVPVPTLPFCVPKCVPKAVHEFPNFLTDVLHIPDPNIAVMKRTLKDMEAQHWDSYKAAGKKRKVREKPIHEGNVSDIPETRQPKVHPTARSAIRRQIATLQRIADEMKSDEMREVLDEIRQIIIS